MNIFLDKQIIAIFSICDYQYYLEQYDISIDRYLKWYAVLIKTELKLFISTMYIYIYIYHAASI